MSQYSDIMHTIRVESPELLGDCPRVWIDGIPLKSAQSVTVEIDKDYIPHVTIKLIAEVRTGEIQPGDNA